MLHWKTLDFNFIWCSLRLSVVKKTTQQKVSNLNRRCCFFQTIVFVLNLPSGKSEEITAVTKGHFGIRIMP